MWGDAGRLVACEEMPGDWSHVGQSREIGRMWGDVGRLVACGEMPGDWSHVGRCREMGRMWGDAGRLVACGEMPEDWSHVGQSREIGRMWGKAGRLVACGEMPEHFHNAWIYTDVTRSKRLPGAQPELVSLPEKVLARDAKRRLRFVVHAADWLPSMLPVGCSPCSRLAAVRVAGWLQSM